MANTIQLAAVDLSIGETEYGSNDLSAAYTDNTIYYSDGTNSGVMISNLSIAPDTQTITFDVTFPDYQSADVWDKVGDSVQGAEYGSAVICVDEATGTLYQAYTEDVNGKSQIKVRSYNGSSWTTLGSNIANAYGQQLAVCGGELYLSYIHNNTGKPTYMKYSAGAWSVLRTDNIAYPSAMEFLVDGNNIYSIYEESATLSNGSNGQRLVIKDVKQEQ